MATESKGEVRNTAHVADAAWCEIQKLHKGRTVDDFICDSPAAIRVCKRIEPQFPGLTPYDMNRALLNARKQGRIKPQHRAACSRK